MSLCMDIVFLTFNGGVIWEDVSPQSVKLVTSDIAFCHQVWSEVSAMCLPDDRWQHVSCSGDGPRGCR